MNVAMMQRPKAAGRVLEGKVALITGSTSGIGLGIARALAGEGAAVVLNGFGKPQEIAASQDGIRSDFGVKVAYSGADMSNPASIAEMIETALADFGQIDILVNNAGIQHVAPLQEFPTAKWDAILAINLSSAFHTTRLALPSMLANKYGRIVNIASAHGLVASPFKSAYVAAKHGMLGLTKVTALEAAEVRHHLQRHLPRLCLYAAGRSADRGPGEKPRHSPRTGDPRRVAGAATQQALRHDRRAWRAHRISRFRCRCFHHGKFDLGRWRLDGTLIPHPSEKKDPGGNPK